METTLKFANARPHVSTLVDLTREERDILDRTVLGYLSPDKPTIKMIHEQVAIAIQGLMPLATPGRETVRRAIRRLDPYRVLVSREGDDVARKRFRRVYAARDIPCPFGRVHFDDWAQDLNQCLLASGLMTLKPRKTMSADRHTVTVTMCRKTRMVFALEISPDVHAKFDPKSLGAANPGGRAGIRNVPDRIATNHDNAVFATATFNQFINQEAV